MAELLILNDGRREVIGRDGHFTDLLRETLGNDAAQWFEDRIQDLQNEIESLKGSECRKAVEEYMRTYFIPKFSSDIRYAGDAADVSERKAFWENEFKSDMEDIYGE